MYHFENGAVVGTSAGLPTSSFFNDVVSSPFGDVGTSWDWPCLVVYLKPTLSAV